MDTVGNNSVADKRGSVSIRLAAVASKSAKSRQIPREFELSSSGSSKVVDLGVSRKHIDFLLVVNSNFGRISYRLRDLKLDNGLFSHPYSFDAPARGTH